MKNKSAEIQGKTAWQSADKFYELLFLYYNDILECKKMGDVSAMVDVFDEILILVVPFIEKHMTPQDINMFSTNDDVLEGLSYLKSENTEHEQAHNHRVRQEVIRILNKKRKRLSFLMAKEGMFLPTNTPNDLPSALRGDDYVFK